MVKNNHVGGDVLKDIAKMKKADPVLAAAIEKHKYEKILKAFKKLDRKLTRVDRLAKGIMSISNMATLGQTCYDSMQEIYSKAEAIIKEIK